MFHLLLNAFYMSRPFQCITSVIEGVYFTDFRYFMKQKKKSVGRSSFHGIEQLMISLGNTCVIE